MTEISAFRKIQINEDDMEKDTGLRLQTDVRAVKAGVLKAKASGLGSLRITSAPDPVPARPAPVLEARKEKPKPASSPETEKVLLKAPAAPTAPDQPAPEQEEEPVLMLSALNPGTAAAGVPMLYKVLYAAG